MSEFASIGARRLAAPARVMAMYAAALLVTGCGNSAAPSVSGTGGAQVDAAMGVGGAPGIGGSGAGGSSGAGGALGVGGAPDGGSAASDGGGDGGSDPCVPSCLLKLVNGCLPAGACMSQGQRQCYANGIKQQPGSGGSETYKDGVLCFTLAASGTRIYTYKDPTGAVLGTTTLNGDGSETLNCPGEPPVTFPASCPAVSAMCVAGTCN